MGLPLWKVKRIRVTWQQHCVQGEALALTAGDAGQEIYLSVMRNLLPPRITEDAAIDRHSNAAVDMRLEPGMKLLELAEQLADITRFYIYRMRACGGRFERLPEDVIDHYAA